MVACNEIAETDDFSVARQELLRTGVAPYVKDARVLEAMGKVPRHEFIPRELRAYAYVNHALPIGHEQTISQPLVVGVMTEALSLNPSDRVLEIGTGSGYQAAVLSLLSAEVYSIEIVEPLAERARDTLQRLGYANVHVRAGDGYLGWPDAAPFDAIIITAAVPRIPEPLVSQLREGGRLVLPLGEEVQYVKRYLKHGKELSAETLLPVQFVPMTGAIRSSPPPDQRH